MLEAFRKQDPYLSPKNNSEAASWILLLYLMNDFFQTIGRFVLTRLAIYGMTREALLFLPTLLPFFMLLFFRRRLELHRGIFAVFLFLMVCIAFLATYLLHPEYTYFYTREQYGISRVFRPDSAIYAFFFVSLVDDPKELLRTMVRFAYIDMAYLIVFSLVPALLQGCWTDVNWDGTTIEMSYNLSFGYEMLFPTFVFLYLFLKQKRKYHLCLGLLGLVLVFTQGSRGALLLIAMFVVLMTVSHIVDTPDTERYRQKKMALVGLFALTLVVLGPVLLREGAELLQSFGFHSRTLRMLAQGRIAESNGRTEIWEAVLGGIREGGILGNGAYGDRPYVFPLHFAAYSHNVILEITCSFGVIGVGLCLWIVGRSAYMFFCCKTAIWRELFIICFCVAGQLLLSLSFWYVNYFWIAAAIAHKYFALKRRNL